MTPPAPVLPVQQTERIQIVGILRGFALFGILFVNMTIFSHPIQAIVLPTDPSLPWHDRAAIWLIHALGEGKFYALFSLLFGLGLFLQMERIEGRGAGSGREASFRAGTLPPRLGRDALPLRTVGSYITNGYDLL